MPVSIGTLVSVWLAVWAAVVWNERKYTPILNFDSQQFGGNIYLEKTNSLMFLNTKIETRRRDAYWTQPHFIIWKLITLHAFPKQKNCL